MVEPIPELLARIERVLGGSAELREALENTRDTLEHIRRLMESKRLAEFELERIQQTINTSVILFDESRLG